MPKEKPRKKHPLTAIEKAICLYEGQVRRCERELNEEYDRHKLTVAKINKRRGRPLLLLRALRTSQEARQ